MNYVVTFEGKRYTAGDPIPGEDQQFIVVADDKSLAMAYAKRFENIALEWSHGIACVESIYRALPEEVERLPNLSRYEEIYPNR